MLGKLTPFVAAVALTFAQMSAEPDFSGDWKLVSSTPSGAEAAIAMTVVQPVKRADVFGKPVKPFFSELLVTRDFGKGPRAERHVIGGMGGTVSSGTRTEHSGSWEGRTLVLENSRYAGAQSGPWEWDKRREEWSFDEEGRLRIALTTQSSQRPEASLAILLYQRR